MPRLVKPQSAAARQPNRRRDAPTGLHNLGYFRALGLERVYLYRGVQVIAHQVNHAAREFVIRMALDKLAVAGMNAYLRGRKREDEPASPASTDWKPSTS